MEKIALLTFNGELVCFAHVLLNALDMKERNHEVEIIVEGAATKLIKTLHEQPDQPFAALYKKVLAQGLITTVCDACAAKMGAKQSALEQGLTLVSDISGHPSIAKFIERGFRVITF
ncbi:MAG: DsrE family protein [Deltaproteobacteria bacterium]|nr:DsrE family protein [Deltaproteobacteria bacterium]